MPTQTPPLPEVLPDYHTPTPLHSWSHAFLHVVHALPCRCPSPTSLYVCLHDRTGTFLKAGAQPHHLFLHCLAHSRAQEVIREWNRERTNEPTDAGTSESWQSLSGFSQNLQGSGKADPPPLGRLGGHTPWGWQTALIRLACPLHLLVLELTRCQCLWFTGWWSSQRLCLGYAYSDDQNKTFTSVGHWEAERVGQEAGIGNAA